MTNKAMKWTKADRQMHRQLKNVMPPKKTNLTECHYFCLPGMEYKLNKNCHELKATSKGRSTNKFTSKTTKLLLTKSLLN